MRWFDNSSDRILNYEFDPDELTYNSYIINSPPEMKENLALFETPTLSFEYNNWQFPDYKLLDDEDQKFIRLVVRLVSDAIFSLQRFYIFSLGSTDYILINKGFLCFYSNNKENLQRIEDTLLNYKKPNNSATK